MKCVHHLRIYKVLFFLHQKVHFFLNSHNNILLTSLSLLEKHLLLCLLNLYRERRIKVLNFFENMAIKYMNNMLDRNLFDAQFKDIILEAAKVFYYDIYKNEGTKSYPSLLMLCKQYEN